MYIALMITYIDLIHDIDAVSVLLTAIAAEHNDQIAQQVSSAIGYRISLYKRNIIHKERCINLQIMSRPNSVIKVF